MDIQPAIGYGRCRFVEFPASLAARGVFVFAAVLAPFMATTGGARALTSGAVRCEIQALTNGAMVTLHGRIFAREPVSGRFLFRAAKSGSDALSSVSQSGEFRAGPDAPAVVGSLKLGGSGETEAALEVFWDGRNISCRLRKGESL
jgi:hypothetical protein